MRFEIDDMSGRALTPENMIAINNSRLTAFQQAVYSEFGATMREVYFSSIGQLGKKLVLRRHLELCTTAQLLLLTRRLCLFSGERDAALLHRLLPTDTGTGTGGAGEGVEQRKDGLVNRLLVLVLAHLTLRECQLEGVNRLSLHPSEELLWDMHQLPAASTYSLDSRSAAQHTFLTLPKLNLQFLTLHDYLLRNFVLFRLESAFEIRQALMESVRRMLPRRTSSGTSFSGWSRTALAISSVSIDEVAKPHIGENIPARVTATLEVDLSKCNADMRAEWEGIREHDVLFLQCINNPMAPSTDSGAGGAGGAGAQNQRRRGQEETERETREFRRTYGVRHVRGGEVFEVRDEANVVLNDMTSPDDRSGGRAGNLRRLRLRLDAAQYYHDMKEGRDYYGGLNLVVRRHGKENNFKPVLETIRDLLNAPAGRARGQQQLSTGQGEESVFHDVPHWLHDLFLGYGSPDAAHYRTLHKRAQPVLAALTPVSSGSVGAVLQCSCVPDECFDYADTFLSASLTASSFQVQAPGQAQVYVADESAAAGAVAGEDGCVLLQLAGGKQVHARLVPAESVTAGAVCAHLAGPPYKVSVWHDVCLSTSSAATGAPAPVLVSVATRSPAKKRRLSKKDQAAAALETASPPAVASSSSATSSVSEQVLDLVLTTPYASAPSGPYPEDIPPQNQVRFTHTQVQAIRPGMNKVPP